MLNPLTLIYLYENFKLTLVVDTVCVQCIDREKLSQHTEDKSCLPAIRWLDTNIFVNNIEFVQAGMTHCV